MILWKAWILLSFGFFVFLKNMGIFTAQRRKSFVSANHMDNIAARAKTNKKIKEGFVGEKRIVLPPNIKRRVLNNKLTRNLYLTAIGYYPHATFHNMERKSGCSEYILIYCVEGEGYIEVNDEEYRLTPNSYFIIPKHAPHHYYAAENNPWSIYWVHYCGDCDEQLYKRFTFDGKPNLRFIPYDASRIHLFEQIYYLLEQNYEMQDMEFMNLNLLHFVSSLIYYKDKNTAVDSEDKVSNSIAFMQNNLHTQFTIVELAEQQQISISHYSRVFKQRTGYSPIHYLNQLKVQKACQHLYFTDKTVKEIAVLFGISDPFYFSRLFTKFMGMSPSQYRKTHKRSR